MTELFSLPAERELHAARLAALRSHLIREVAEPATRPRHRFKIAVAAALIACVGAIATPAFGIGNHVLHLFGQGSTPGVSVDQAKAQLVGAVTSDGQSVALWHGPSQSGGDCLYLQHAGGPSPAIAGNGGGLCSVTSQPLQNPIQTFVTWDTKDSGGATAIVVGRFDTTKIASVELQTASESIPVTASGGYFIAALPDADTVGSLPSGGPFVLVGHDAAGGEVARVDLASLIANSNP